jgi:hypothetical protein
VLMVLSGKQFLFGHSGPFRRRMLSQWRRVLTNNDIC